MSHTESRGPNNFRNSELQTHEQYDSLDQVKLIIFLVFINKLINRIVRYSSFYTYIHIVNKIKMLYDQRHRHDISEILLKVTLNLITLTLTPY